MKCFLVSQIREAFSVSQVTREDLEWKGFDVSNVTDEDMERIASMMDDSYLDNGFWQDLVAAADECGIPKNKED